MPKITYLQADGTEHAIEAELGSTVMEVARCRGIGGIVGECGGSATCATCVVHVEPAWVDVVGPPSAEEEIALDLAFDVRPNSRLACQIPITEAINGLIVRTPAYQGR